jgi:HEPN domain-containing protein
MTQTKAHKLLLQSAKRNLKVAKDNYKLKHYDWSLFFWHLVIEKTLKSIITKNGKVPPPIPNLNKLAKEAKLDLTKEQEDNLKEITTYNLEARYDDYKLSFYKKANKEYTDKWSKNCEEFYLWLKKQI